LKIELFNRVAFKTLTAPNSLEEFGVCRATHVAKHRFGVPPNRSAISRFEIALPVVLIQHPQRHDVRVEYRRQVVDRAAVRDHRHADLEGSLFQRVEVEAV